MKNKTHSRKQYSFLIVSLLLLQLGGPLSAQSAETAGAKRLGVFITGLSGSHEFKEHFQDALRELREALLREGFKREDLILFSEEPGDSLWHEPKVSTRENLREFFKQLKEKNTRYAEAFIFVAGHANGFDDKAVLHLPGDDMGYKELMDGIDAVSARRTVIVVAAPQGEAWIRKLSRPGRVVMVGSGDRQYDFIPLLFLRLFPRVLGEATSFQRPSPENPRSPLRSLFDVFSETERRVQAWYQRNNLALTERALLDGDGDGKGISGLLPIKEEDDTRFPDAKRASQILLLHQGESYGKP